MANSPYTLGARCLAEFIGMIIVIGMGESALANELLPNTKVCQSSRKGLGAMMSSMHTCSR